MGSTIQKIRLANSKVQIYWLNYNTFCMVVLKRVRSTPAQSLHKL